MKIGLTYNGSDEKHQYYADWLSGNENIEVVRLSVDDNNLQEIRQCDALVLSGGVDIHPSFYGGREQYPNAPSNGWREDRDVFEQSVLTLALQKSIPILGICRGMQLINVTLNGSLKQDLGDDRLNKVHKGNPDKQHMVKIDWQSLLHELTGVTQAEVNSAHHQAINEVGHGLMVNCTAEDGTIEGLEWAIKANKPFLLAIQWHPERMFRFNLQDSPLAGTLRNKFIEEVSKSKASKQ